MTNVIKPHNFMQFSQFLNRGVTTYHLRDARRRARGINGLSELFNYRHVSLRNCIERCFSVLNARFPILRYMTNFYLIRQREIAICCCVLHNFIKLHNQGDLLFDRYRVGGVMSHSDFNSENDATSSSGTTQNQGGAMETIITSQMTCGIV